MQKNIINDKRTKPCTALFLREVNQELTGSGLSVVETEPKHGKQLAFKVVFSNPYVQITIDTWKPRPDFLNLVHVKAKESYLNLDLQVTWNHNNQKFFIASK